MKNELTVYERETGDFLDNFIMTPDQAQLIEYLLKNDCLNSKTYEFTITVRKEE